MEEESIEMNSKLEKKTEVKKQNQKKHNEIKIINLFMVMVELII